MALREYLDRLAERYLIKGTSRPAIIFCDMPGVRLDENDMQTRQRDIFDIVAIYSMECESLWIAKEGGMEESVKFILRNKSNLYAQGRDYWNGFVSELDSG